MKEQVREFSATMNRPFDVRYNALTQSIEVLDQKDKVLRFAQNIRGDLTRLISAMEKMH